VTFVAQYMSGGEYIREESLTIQFESKYKIKILSSLTEITTALNTHFLNIL
jgi:hypothetical protein